MRTFFCIAAGSLMLALAGCDKSTSPQSETGFMRVNMVDSPAAYDQVNIVVDSVQAHIDINDTTAGWFTLSNTQATYDLLVYVNGNFAVIGGAELPVGRYSQVRLYIGSGSNIVVDGETKPLVIPSGVQSGVKLNIDAMISSDATTTVMLDFDANLSIVKSGNPINPTYTLKPVIRTTTTSSTGLIAGVAVPSSPRPVIWATSNTGAVVTTTTDANGSFKFVNMEPGTYTIRVTSDEALYADRVFVGVILSSETTVDLGTITLERK